MSEIIYNAKMLIPFYPDTRLVGVLFSLTKKKLRGENKDRGGKGEEKEQEMKERRKKTILRDM